MSPEWDGAERGELERGIRGTVFAGRGAFFATVGSTIDVLRAMADDGAPEGAFVLADAQDRGRGQRGRAWHSPPGAGLYLSALLRPALDPSDAEVLTSLAGVAVADALCDDPGLAVALKAPNDVLLAVGGRWAKIAGVLVDCAVQGPILRHAILSVGLNVDLRNCDMPMDLRGLATSLAEATGAPFGRARAAAGVLRRLDAVRVQAIDPAARRRALERHSELVRDVAPGDPA